MSFSFVTTVSNLVSVIAANPRQVQSHPGAHHSFPLVAALQLRALGIPGPITGVKYRGEEGIKCLCFIFISICEMTNLTEQQTNVFFSPPFAGDMLGKAFLLENATCAPDLFTSTSKGCFDHPWTSHPKFIA